MYKTAIFTVLVLGFLAITGFADELEDALQAHGIPGFENINKTAVAENVQKAFQEKCTANGGPEAYGNVMDGQADLQECIEQKLNASTIMEELEEAKKTGSMDDVFGKYCRRSPAVLDCVRTFTGKLEQCLEAAEKDNIKTVMNITESLTNFLCYKDGDRMAMFIAEGGLECIESKKEGLQKCGNETIGKRIPQTNDFTGESLPLLLFEAQDCRDFDDFHDCAVEELETCKDNTPANIIDALFKFIRKSIPCKEPRKELRQSKSPSSASVPIGSFVVVLSSFFLLTRI